MEKINDPIIEEYTDTPYTKIEFMMDYDKICIKSKDEHSVNWIIQNNNLVNDIITRRAYEVAVYMQKTSVYFNDLKI